MVTAGKEFTVTGVTVGSVNEVIVVTMMSNGTGMTTV